MVPKRQRQLLWWAAGEHGDICTYESIVGVQKDDERPSVRRLNAQEVVEPLWVSKPVGCSQPAAVDLR